MEHKIITKLLAAILAFILTFMNVIILSEAIAASQDLEGQLTTVANTDVEFDAYFKEGEETQHSKKINTSQNKDVLYLDIKVLDGYLANGIVKLEDTNFNLLELEEENEIIENIDITTNTIFLNKIEKEGSVTLELPIEINTDSNFAVSNLNKVSKVILEGTFVNANRTLLNTTAKETQISKAIEVSSSIEADAISNIEEEVIKYVKFDTNGKKGVILQTLLKSNLVNNSLPVKQTELEIEVPTINEISPEKVVVTIENTEATNGQKEVVLTDNDYKYEDGKITLLIENKIKEDGTISWLKDVQDEIILTYVYGEEAILDTAIISLSSNNKIISYNDETKVIEGSNSQTITLEEKIGDIVSYDIEISEENLPKGYMLAQNSNYTQYTEKLTANIGYTELVDNIVMENNTYYIDKYKNKFLSEPIYTYTKISAQNFMQILGEDGFVKISDNAGNEIATLNKDNLEYMYEVVTTYINIETSKPIAEGRLEIENGRAIKPAEYDKVQIMNFDKIETRLSAKVNYQEQELIRTTVTKETELVNPKTEVEADISQTSLSTAETNEQVELRVVLDTSDNTKNLYKNPKITVEFPSYIEDLTEGKVALLYDDELRLGALAANLNENGNIVVEIPVLGEQTAYNKSSVSKGATIIIYANIDVKEITPKIEDNIKLYITNENDDNENIVAVPVNYAAKSGIITRSIISGYSNKNEEVKVIGEKNTALIKPNDEKKDITIKMDVVNSTEKDITNVVILGRIPFEGNKHIVTEEDLGSTFTTNLLSNIKMTYGVTEEDVKVYYSINGNANTDLEDVENGWEVLPTDFSDVKSYMIVVKNDILPLGAGISFEYNAQIPENIAGERETYSTFAVYYNEAEVVEQEVSETITDLVEETKKVVTGIARVEEAVEIGLITEKAEEPETITTPEDIIPTEASQEIPEENNPTPTPIEETEEQIRRRERIQNNILTKVTRTSEGRTIGNNDTVKEGQYIEYEVEITNYNDEDLTLDIEVSKQNGTFYGIKTERFGEDIFDEVVYNDYYTKLEEEVMLKRILVKSGETENFKYAMYVDKDTEGLELLNVVSIKHAETKAEKVLQTSNIITNGELELVISTNKDAKIEIYSDTGIPIFINAKNISDVDFSSVSIEVDLGDKFAHTNEDYYVAYRESEILEEIEDELQLSRDGNKIIFKFNNFKAGEQERIHVNLRTKSINLNEQSAEFSLNAIAKIDDLGNNKYISNTYSNIMKQRKTNLVASASGSILDEYINDGDELKYIFEIENQGVIDENNLIVKDMLPEGLELQKYRLIDSNGNDKTEDLNNMTFYEDGITVKAGEKVTLELYTVVNAEKIDSTGLIRNNAVLSGNHFEQFETNVVSYMLNPSEPAQQEELPSLIKTNERPNANPTSSEVVQQGTTIEQRTESTYKAGVYSISGMVWNDANSNGSKDGHENGISGMTVMLKNNQTAEFVKDALGNEVKVKTSLEGKYQFKDLPSGEYIVMFMYDSDKYNITTYQKGGINSVQNSDAIEGNIKLNGLDTKVALSDIIRLGQASKENVNLGLVTLTSFDLRLDKVINTVIVQNDQGTNKYTFKNNKLGKVEIPAKYIVGSTLMIEYIISVTNEGGVSGNATKIVDYIPTGLEFSSDLNKNWYMGTDKNLYTTALENTEIRPGETKKVKLVLTKKLTEDASEIVNNSAEISASYNTQGLIDLDSISGNKAQKEDDLSEANLIITLKTGAITYTLLAVGIIGIIAILGTGIYLIKKKVLDRNI